jgi:biopolymer transport protein ExbD
MNFRPRSQEAPEINLIPFIDILLVVIIFMVLTTTYAHFTALKIQLPYADAQALQTDPNEIVVVVDRNGSIAINGATVDSTGVLGLQTALTALAANRTDTLVVIKADANSAHQSVVHVMDAARRAGLSRITFAAQSLRK